MERILIAAVFNQFHIKRVGYGGCPDIRDTPLRTSQYKLQNLVAARFSRRCTSKKKVFRSKADIPNDEVVLCEIIKFLKPKYTLQRLVAAASRSDSVFRDSRR